MTTKMAASRVFFLTAFVVVFLWTEAAKKKAVSKIDVNTLNF
jgi:hypothetical protein